MKHKLLLLGASLMVSVSLSAQSFTANREKVVPEFTDWAMEEYCYLWNEGAQGFYTNHQGPREAPYWSTRAVVSDTIGQQVMFSRTNPGGQAEDWEADGVLENTCLLTSYVSAANFNNFYCTFADGWNGIWTDNNTNAYRYFNVVSNPGNNSIKIERNMMLASGGAAEEGKYLGVLASDADKTVKLHDTEEYMTEDEEPYYNIDPSETFYEDWYVVSQEAYDAWVAAGGKEKARLFLAAASLKSALEKAYADNPGINTLNEPLAVYNNMDATVEDLQDAEATIQGHVIDWIKIQGGGTPENPVDFTSSIINPTFDVVGDFHGWQGTAFGAGGNTYSNAEHYGKTFDTYQDLTGLPGGVYFVSCNGYTRYQNEQADYNAWKAGTPSETKIYLKSEANGMFSTPIKHVSEGGSIDEEIGGNGTVSVTFTDEYGDEHTLYTPNYMTSANDYFNDPVTPNRYYNEAFGAVEEGETLRIGVINEKATGSDWSIFDDFKLFYIGNEPASYQYWGSKVAANNQISFDGFFYGAPEKAKYDNAISTLTSASNKTDIMNAIQLFETMADEVAESRTNYEAYYESYLKGLDFLVEAQQQGITGDEVGLLADYLEADAGDVEEGVYPNGCVRDFLPTIDEGEGEGKLSAAEILEEKAFLDNMVTEAIANGMTDGTDLTSFIINPDFQDPLVDGRANGWSLDTSNGGTNSLTNWRGGNSTNYCAEAYQQKFDVYQVLQRAVPNGLYEVSVQAYYRTGTNENAYQAYLEDPDMVGPAKVYTYVYFNDFATPVKNSMEILYNTNLANNCVNVGTDDEGNPLWCLNGMASASEAFSMTDESMNFTQKVYGLVTDGKIRLGIRNLENAGSYTWSLWDNFHLKYRAKNEEALAEVIESYSLMASEITDPYGVPEQTALVSATEAAANAKGGEAMYDALIDLVSAYNDALKSVKLYKEVEQLISDLNDTFDEYQDQCTEEARDAASDIYDNYSDGLGQYEYDNANMEIIKDEIAAAIAGLKIPGDYPDASDDNPVDFTGMIINPSYEDATCTGWEGSTKDLSGLNRTDMVEYYYASFDHHQTIKNLPAGTYELTLNCFNRIPGNNAQEDLNAFQAGQKLEKMAAFVYATVGDQTFAEPFRMVSEPMRTEWVLGGTYTEATSNDSPDVIYCPNNMIAAGAAFEEVDPDTDEPLDDVQNYRVRVVFTLTEAGDVTIGCKNSATDTWAIWDNWTLTYFGTESEKQDSHDATGVLSIEDNNSVVSSEIFTVGGARVSSLQRGINIVKTHMSDGTVKIQKVLVK